jgi:hypothetical protein
MWIESRMFWTSLFTIYWMQIVYQNPSMEINALKCLVELISAACYKFVLSKIRGYRSMLMNILFTFPGYYCLGEGNTINKSISISLWLLNGSCRLIKSLKNTDQVYVRNVSWFTVIISDSVLQWKPIFLSTLK